MSSAPSPRGRSPASRDRPRRLVLLTPKWQFQFHAQNEEHKPQAFAGNQPTQDFVLPMAINQPTGGDHADGGGEGEGGRHYPGQPI